MADGIRGVVRRWRARDVTSARMMATAIGLLGLLVPFSLYGVVAGPTGGDRLAALAFAGVCAALGLYSLWEAKSPIHAERRSRRGRGDGNP